jgi:hypothetical protein
MILRCVTRFLIVLALCECALGQSPTPLPCQIEIHKSDPNALFIRVSDRVTNILADQKILPDISDMQGKNLDSLVVVHILVGTDGAVRCFQLQQGDPDLAQRSLDAARNGTTSPTCFNGNKVFVDTWIRFSYKKDDVKVVLPDR